MKNYLSNLLLMLVKRINCKHFKYSEKSFWIFEFELEKLFWIVDLAQDLQYFKKTAYILLETKTFLKKPDKVSQKTKRKLYSLLDQVRENGTY